MSVLIWHRTNEGRTRVCNSRCYDAKTEKCLCICEGINHGVGLDKALANTWQLQLNPPLHGPDVLKLVFLVRAKDTKKKDIIIDKVPTIPLSFFGYNAQHTKPEE